MTDTATVPAPSGPTSGGRTPGEPRPGRYQHTALTLIGAIVACLAIIAVVVILVVRPDQEQRQPVDWHSAAADVASSISPDALDPQLPDGWTANVAELRQVDDVQTFVIALLSPNQGYVELDQGFIDITADPTKGATWQHDELDGVEPSGSTVIDGLSWQTIDRRSEQNTGNFAYSMVADLGASTVVLHGTATATEFTAVAQTIATQMRERTAPSAAPTGS